MLNDNSYISFNIASSCVARDIFGIHDQDLNEEPDGKYKILQYTNGFSPLFLDQTGIYIDEEKYDRLKSEYKKINNKEANFWMRCRYLTITKMFYDFIYKQQSDFIIFDSGIFRYNYICFENGIILPDYHRDFVNWLIQQGVLPKIKNVISFESISTNMLDSMIRTFADNIMMHYDLKNIILIDIKAVNIEYDNIKKKFTMLNNAAIDKINARLKTGFELLKKYFDGAHIIKAPDLIIGNKNHRWGRHLLHYQYEYYFDYYKKCIDTIVENYAKNNTEKLDEVLLEFEHVISKKIYRIINSA